MKLTEHVQQCPQCSADCTRLCADGYRLLCVAAAELESAALRNPRRVRFWIKWNWHWTKITVSADRPVRLHSYERDTEGYSVSGEVYHLEGGRVVRDSIFSGRDCDGEIYQGGRSICEIHELKSIEASNEGDDPRLRESCFNGDRILRPAWREVDEWKRDMAAEKAGY